MLGGVPVGLSPKTAPPDPARGGSRLFSSPDTCFPPSGDRNEEWYEGQNESPAFVDRLREAASPAVPLADAKKLLSEEKERSSVRALALKAASEALETAAGWTKAMQAEEQVEKEISALVERRVKDRESELRRLYAIELVRKAEIIARASALAERMTHLEKEGLEMVQEAEQSQARLDSFLAEAAELELGDLEAAPAEEED